MSSTSISGGFRFQQQEVGIYPHASLKRLGSFLQQVQKTFNKSCYNSY